MVMSLGTTDLPGVQIAQFEPAVAAELATGVAGFVGFAIGGALSPEDREPRLYTSWHDFAYDFRDGDRWRTSAARPWHPDDLLWHAVQGFFGNGGERCYVVLCDPTSTGIRAQALEDAIYRLAEADEVDVVCAPSLMGAVDPGALQRELVVSSAAARAEHHADWFLILDGPNPRPGLASRVRALEPDLASWVAALRATGVPLVDAALYHQWIVPGGDHEPAPEASPEALALGVPPSGHLAGIYARTDRRIGVHKAPANEEILGIVDFVTGTAGTDGVNELVALPGRGLRVWGARTLAEVASSADPDGWINIRRVMLMLKRWLVRALEWTVFEANDFRLWVRVHRELEAKLTDLFLRGAFQGKSPDEAFRIKCDEENNPADARAAGRLQVDVQVAPAAPQQFIQIRLIRSAEGLTVE